MVNIAHLLLYVPAVLGLPPMLTGLIRSGKARLQGRAGPSPLQPYWDLAKYMGKRETVSTTAGWAFRAGPIPLVAAMVTVALMTPWLGVPSPIPGDLFLAVYLLAVAKFCTATAALDTGSAFAGLGASRDAAISVQAEPALILGLGAMAVRSGSSAFAVMFSSQRTGAGGAEVMILVAIALWMAAIAEMSRMPVDDPSTHLELTMIHEAQILEYSGARLAMVEYASSLKIVVLLGLVGQAVLAFAPPLGAVEQFGASIAALVVGAAVVVLLETALVRLRWRRTANFLSYGLGAATLACLIVSLRGAA